LKSCEIATNVGLYVEFRRHQKRMSDFVAFVMAPNISTSARFRQGARRKKFRKGRKTAETR